MPKFMEEIQDCGPPELRETLRRYGWTKAQIRMVCKQLDEVCKDEDEYQYMDNLRVARKSNAAEVTEYNVAAEQGCCGVYDEELEIEAGGNKKEIILFGFNFGH